MMRRRENRRKDTRPRVVPKNHAPNAPPPLPEEPPELLEDEELELEEDEELEEEELDDEELELLLEELEDELEELDELLTAAKVTTALLLVTEPAELETTTV